MTQPAYKNGPYKIQVHIVTHTFRDPSVRQRGMAIFHMDAVHAANKLYEIHQAYTEAIAADGTVVYSLGEKPASTGGSLD